LLLLLLLLLLRLLLLLSHLLLMLLGMRMGSNQVRINLLLQRCRIIDGGIVERLLRWLLLVRVR